MPQAAGRLTMKQLQHLHARLGSVVWRCDPCLIAMVVVVQRCCVSARTCLGADPTPTPPYRSHRHAHDKRPALQELRMVAGCVPASLAGP